jgi:hypothetical protein
MHAPAYVYPRHDYRSGGECPQSMRIIPDNVEISVYGRDRDYATCHCCATRIAVLDCDVPRYAKPGDKVAV